MAKLTPEEIQNTSFMVDENSTDNDRLFEDGIKKLMLEQGTDDVSSVKIPIELIEQLEFKKSYTPDALRFADHFFSKSSRLVAMAIKSEDYPKSPNPQIAFIGRSNVGKSSLLNSLLGDTHAHVSKTPVATPTGLKRIYKTVKSEILENVSCLPNIVQCSTIDKRGVQQIRNLILEVTSFDKENFNKPKQSFDMPEARLPVLPPPTPSIIKAQARAQQLKMPKTAVPNFNNRPSIKPEKKQNINRIGSRMVKQ
eukprot:gene15498-18409_t